MPRESQEERTRRLTRERVARSRAKKAAEQAAQTIAANPDLSVIGFQPDLTGVTDPLERMWVELGWRMAQPDFDSSSPDGARVAAAFLRTEAARERRKDRRNELVHRWFETLYENQRGDFSRGVALVKYPEVGPGR